MTRGLSIAVGLFVVLAFLMLISEFKMGARIAQGGLVIAVVVVTLTHEKQLVAFLQTVGGTK